MPGIVVFRRRWSVGSDDLVVPGAFLFSIHLIWTIILSILLNLVAFNKNVNCILLLWILIIGYLIILILSMLIELWICIVAMRGSILDTTPRASMQYVLYLRVVVMTIEAGWLSAGIAWIVKYYNNCPIENAKETILGMLVCNWCILISVLITVWCTYDAAGRSWVKMKQYQRSMRESESKFQYKRSGSTRNWRQRKVIRAYEDSWHQRCRFLFCCASSTSDRNRNSFADIARLLSDFFRDLDVVPSDVIVGLVLLRKFQKIERKTIVEQHNNETYEFLSGVPITPHTQFLSLNNNNNDNNNDYDLFQNVIHYAYYAVRAYGWPIYMITSPTLGVCRLCKNLHCCVLSPTCQKIDNNVEIVQDNCCKCNYAALQTLKDLGDIEIIYATYHVDIGETPFFVALDYDKRKIVISIRGTLSMKDILTDLNAEGETLPLQPPKEDWLGHKGMVQAAQYILNKMDEEALIQRALNYCPERGTNEFEIVIVGHSLGAGTASILGILLRQQYATLQCYCYSPPGGLLSMPAVEYTKSFTISVVVGKDVVPRIGLHQMEALRADLINAIKRSVDPKWKTITCSLACCGCSQPTSAIELSTNESDVEEYMRSKRNARYVGGLHPSDATIALTSHQPLYPPGRIIHIVRHHPNRSEQSFSKREPVYQALWAQNIDFDEVLISPVMIQDHMPDKVLDALNKVVTYPGPKKPRRLSLKRPQLSPIQQQQSVASAHRLFLETSFTNLQSPSLTSRTLATNTGFSRFPSPLTLTANSPQSLNLPPLLTVKNLCFKTRGGSVGDRLDLIHDDWFGLAPLASPESLSEVSSISSRTIHVLSQQQQLETPLKLPMRRTPKITGDLYKCADDLKVVRNFEKLKIFGKLDNNSSSSNSNLSYESAINHKLNNNNNNNNFDKILICGSNNESDNYQSAEDILDNVLTCAGCKDFFNDNTTFMETHFDFLLDEQKFEEPSTVPLEDFDSDLLPNLAIDLNLDEQHRSQQFMKCNQTTSKTTSIDSGNLCKTPSDITTKNVTFNPQVIDIEENRFVIKSTQSSPVKKQQQQQQRRSWNNLFQINKNRQKSKSVELPQQQEQQTTNVPKTILCSTLKKQHDSPATTRTETLPLLTGISVATTSVTINESPSFIKRKKSSVYPVEDKTAIFHGSDTSV